jgi:formylglycine-generating enzyme required for sulfatase activity
VDLGGDGRLPVTFLIRVSPGQPLKMTKRLRAAAKEHDRMVPIEAGTATLTGGSVQVPAFLIDAFEVTNEDYVRFVSAGGYANPSFWPETMIAAGRPVPRAEALRRFVDRTNLPGPRFWSGGTFPEGRARHPVTGVSWYEASAFARWAGKRLPTYAQWWRAAVDTAAGGLPWGSDMKTATLRANFGQAGTREVGAYPSGVSPFGCYDMAGNVREWLGDAQPGGPRRDVTGGSWQDEVYMFEPSHVEWFEPSYANEAIGFRLVTMEPASGGQGAPP